MNTKTWIARDADNMLFLYLGEEPIKNLISKGDFDITGVGEVTAIEDDLYPEITHENSPVEIQLNVLSKLDKVIEKSKEEDKSFKTREEREIEVISRYVSSFMNWNDFIKTDMYKNIPDVEVNTSVEFSLNSLDAIRNSIEKSKNDLVDYLNETNRDNTIQFYLNNIRYFENELANNS